MINICQVLREMLKTETEGTCQTLMYWKTMFDRHYRINSTKRSLKFTEKCGTTFCYRLTVSAWVHLFINIRLPGPRA